MGDQISNLFLVKWSQCFRNGSTVQENKNKENVCLEASTNVNEVIRAVLNSLFVFYQKILQKPKTPKAPKSTEKHKKAQQRNHAKAQNANNRAKIKIALKKTSEWKK